MGLEIEAIYERGALKLLDKLPLQEGQKVKITIHSLDSAVDRLYGMLKWTGKGEDLDYLLGPEEGLFLQENCPFSGRSLATP